MRRAVNKKGKKSTRSTVLFAIACLSTIAVVGAAAFILRESATETEADVRAEAETLLNQIEAKLPRGTLIDEQQEVVKNSCSGGGAMYAYSRSLTTREGFDRAAWIYSLKTQAFSGDGYETQIRTLGSRDAVELKIVDRRLLITRIIASSHNNVTLNLTSRCGTG